MKRTLSLMLFILPLLMIACGGGGGGGGADPFAVQPGTTPLSDTDPSTENGTYKVRELEYYYSNGNYFTTNELDYFDGTIVINYGADTIQMKMEWHDSFYGDFYDFQTDSLSNPTPDPGTTWDAYYYQIVGDYDLTIYYDNMCSGGYCADTVVKLRKISNSTTSIPLGMISTNTEQDNETPELISNLMVNFSK